jgi:IPT/TIG domain
LRRSASVVLAWAVALAALVGAASPGRAALTPDTSAAPLAGPPSDPGPPAEAGCPPAVATLHAVECAGIRPVPSLDPAATDAAWHRLAHGHQAVAGTATTACRPLRAVFYTATDWRRLATKLAASASACADYYISVPPLTADKTQERSDEAWRIRALGSNFHALAEINMSAWSGWIADAPGRTWYQAGVAARGRMAAAGYDVSLGDTFAVNEFSSAVRQGSGTARADARNFVHGLFDGDGTLPTSRGTVFIVGLGQGTTFLSTYKTNLENWLQDSDFWTDMSAYVSDWSQEVYGDFRNYGVPGSTLPTRRDYLNDYLEHEIVLAGVGPDTIATARTYLQQAYSPLANGAWQWTSGFGWTSISADQMKNFVSAQTYALRFFSGASGQGQDHWGFAWAPNNSTGIPAADFTAQSGDILDRLAAAIRDSAQALDPNDPGIGACGPLGQNLWCAGEIAGASFNPAWQTFRFWAAPTISSFSPTSGAAGTSVTITGTNFTGATAVRFNGVSDTTFTVVSSTQITAKVPSGATSGPITVTTAGGTATSSMSFTVTGALPPAPTISSFSPTSGTAGASVTITGTNLTGATAVAFNGTSVVPAATSSTQVTATVPAGATSGPISVTTPGGTATSQTSFTVTGTPPPPPTISSFSPASGAAGASVTITGTNFTGATAVGFNGVSAAFTAPSSTQIMATVPSGATSGPITVTVGGVTATSAKRFHVTQ